MHALINRDLMEPPISAAESKTKRAPPEPPASITPETALRICPRTLISSSLSSGKNFVHKNAINVTGLRIEYPENAGMKTLAARQVDNEVISPRGMSLLIEPARCYCPRAAGNGANRGCRSGLAERSLVRWE